MNLKNAELCAGLVSIIWGLIYGYKLLQHIGATELLWFLYVGSIPLAVMLAILAALVDD